MNWKNILKYCGKEKEDPWHETEPPLPTCPKCGEKLLKEKPSLTFEEKIEPLQALIEHLKQLELRIERLVGEDGKKIYRNLMDETYRKLNEVSSEEQRTVYVN